MVVQAAVQEGEGLVALRRTVRLKPSMPVIAETSSVGSLTGNWIATRAVSSMLDW